jgi:ketosteroid isomerase-like protein
MIRIALLGMVVSAACARTPQIASTNDRAVLDSIRRGIETAENTGDADRMYAYLAPDVVAMPPNMPPVSGADASREWLRGFFGAFNVENHYQSEEIVISGDWAFDRGTVTESMTPKAGGPPMKSNSKYVWMYRRVNGAWKQARVIWNSSDAPPNAAGPPSQPK